MLAFLDDGGDDVVWFVASVMLMDRRPLTLRAFEVLLMRRMLLHTPAVCLLLC